MDAYMAIYLAGALLSLGFMLVKIVDDRPKVTDALSLISCCVFSWLWVGILIAILLSDKKDARAENDERP